MVKAVWVQVVVQLEIVELLPHDAHHAGQGGADRIGPRDAALGIQNIGETPSDAMGLALDLRDAVAHCKEQRSILEFSREQPKPIVA